MLQRRARHQAVPRPALCEGSTIMEPEPWRPWASALLTGDARCTLDALIMEIEAKSHYQCQKTDNIRTDK